MCRRCRIRRCASLAGGGLSAARQEKTGFILLLVHAHVHVHANLLVGAGAVTQRGRVALMGCTVSELTGAQMDGPDYP